LIVTENLIVTVQNDLHQFVSFLGPPSATYHPDSDIPVIRFFGSPNLLVSSVYSAFYRHYPLKLNPNIIWLTILQGFSRYVNLNSEALRGKFVTHQGQATISVCRPDFRYQSPSNDWESVFPQFSDGIEANTVPGVREKIECRFSNTTATDRACSHISLMDICQKYFHYEMCCGCGFPRIDLLGTVEDWRLLREKAEGLKQFQPTGKCDEEVEHLSVWLEALLPALDHFVAAAEGNPDLPFWGSVCNLCGLSGMIGSPVTGWIGVLFPYLIGGESLRRNWALNLWRKAFDVAKSYGVEKALELASGAQRLGFGGRGDDDDGKWLLYGIKLESFPSSLSKAPVAVTWLDVGKKQDVLFYGGIFAMHQHPDGALEVRTGWAVVDAVAAKKSVRPFGD
jgi:hypothetical protein